MYLVCSSQLLPIAGLHFTKGVRSLEAKLSRSSIVFPYAISTNLDSFFQHFHPFFFFLSKQRPFFPISCSYQFHFFSNCFFFSFSLATFLSVSAFLSKLRYQKKNVLPPPICFERENIEMLYISNNFD